MNGLSILPFQLPQRFAGLTAPGGSTRAKSTKAPVKPKPNSVFYDQSTVPLLRTFVEGGLGPLRAGDYEQTIGYYLGDQASRTAKKVGITLSIQTVDRQIPKTLQGARAQSEQSIDGHFGAIKRMRFVPVLIARFPVYPLQKRPPNTVHYMNRDTAYMLAEEWSHSVQHKSKHPLTDTTKQFLTQLGLLGRLTPNDTDESLCDLANQYGEPIQRKDFVALFEETYGKKLARDMRSEVAFMTIYHLLELDLALYFIEKKIPLTQGFLMEYNRRRLIDTSGAVMLSDQLRKLKRIPKPTEA